MELNNGNLKLSFNESGHLVSWTDLSSGVTYSLQHDYLQEIEKENLNEVNVCDGTNVYTFVPDDGNKLLTPEVSMYGQKYTCTKTHQAIVCLM